MLKIAICDDEKLFHKTMEKLIVLYLEKRGIEYDIDTFDSGKQVLDLGGKLIQYAIIFLDINMDEVDGIETAKKIRSISQEIYIVFVTAYVKYSLEGYKVNAIRYLLKDNRNFIQTVHECMNAILNALSYETPKIIFDFKEGRKEILVDRIIYLESYLHTVTFHIMEDEEKTYRMTTTLNDMESILDVYAFLRIHQSYLVNLKHVKSIKLYQAKMDNGAELPIPRPKYRKVKELFVEFKGEL